MKLVIVLLALAALAFASGTITGQAGGVADYAPPATDSTLDSYAYNAAEQMSTIGASFDDYAAVDDYNGISSSIDTYTAWGVTTASAPTALEIMVVADDSGVPSASGPTSQTSYTATLTDTGMIYGGYPIWIVFIELCAAPISVTAPVWIGLHRADGSDWYPIGGTTVTGSEAYRTLDAGWSWEPFSYSLVEGDLFKIIVGPPYSSLNRSTWAGVKSAF